MPDIDWKNATEPRASSTKPRNGTADARHGVVAVEFAIVFPLFLVLVFGAIDVGRAVMVRHKLTEAARAGCRLYIIKNELTEQDAQDMVDEIMSDANLAGYDVQFDPYPMDSIEHLDPVTVSVSIPFDQACWFSGSWYLSDRTLTGTCTMPGDTGEIPEDDGGGVGGDDDDDDGGDDDDDDDDGGGWGGGWGGGRGGRGGRGGGGWW